MPQTSNQNLHSNLQVLLQNLKDLDDISKRVFNEFKLKNHILESGLKECVACQMQIQLK